MRLAIMQPYILPYIGYFQLINAVDKFVIYDNIQFTKKGWINRNRILVNGHDEYITLPLKKDSDYLNVNERVLADIFPETKIKLLRKLTDAYKKAPQFEVLFPLLLKIINSEEINLFKYIYSALKVVCNYLEINTEIIISSTIPINHQLKSHEKVIAICKELEATNYVNPIGGMELYSFEIFKKNGIDLKFIKTNLIEYKQFNYDFTPWLSIIDVLMFNSKENVQNQIISGYTII